MLHTAHDLGRGRWRRGAGKGQIQGGLLVLLLTAFPLVVLWLEMDNELPKKPAHPAIRTGSVRS